MRRTRVRLTPVCAAEEGVEAIRKGIQDGTGKLVVAACSSRFITDTFTFDGVVTERGQPARAGRLEPSGER